MNWIRVWTIYPHGTTGSIENGCWGWGDAQLEECGRLWAEAAPEVIVMLEEAS
jgi:hypothetical protein